MKKTIIQIIILILLSLNVFADFGNIETYRPNEIFSLAVHLTNSTGDATAANCSLQIRSSDYSRVLDSQMYEINGGWYNYTYNTSTTGRYFCRYNCTQGSAFSSDTCDFIIGDTNMGAIISIVLILLFIIVYYMYMARNFTFKILNEDGALKILFFMGALWLVLVPMNFAIYLSDTYLGNTGISNTLVSVYQFLIATDYLISAYFFLWILIFFINKLRGKA